MVVILSHTAVHYSRSANYSENRNKDAASSIQHQCRVGEGLIQFSVSSKDSVMPSNGHWWACRLTVNIALYRLMQ